MVDKGSIATPTPKPGAGLGATGGVTWKPEQYYSFPADPAASVKDLVAAGAGAGKVQIPIPTTIRVGQSALPGPSLARPAGNRPVYNTLGAELPGDREEAIGLWYGKGRSGVPAEKADAEGKPSR